MTRGWCFCSLQIRTRYATPTFLAAPPKGVQPILLIKLDIQFSTFSVRHMVVASSRLPFMLETSAILRASSTERL